MKKITSVLLAMVLLASMLCTSAMAADVDGSSYVGAKTSVNLPGKTVTVKITAVEETTAGKITVGYDAAKLSYDSIEINGKVTSHTESDGSVTFGYAASTSDAIKAGGLIATLTFHIDSAKGTTSISAVVKDFNEGIGLDAALPSMSVKLESTAVTPGYPTTPGGSTTPGTTPGSEVTPPAAEIEPSEVYSDVDATQWYYPAVSYVVNQGYFKGTSENEFAPNDTMNRAMFVTVLGRMAGIDESAAVTSAFTDVPEGQWYTAAVVWGSEAGIVMGTTDDHFDTSGPVTREQMTVFLYRYAQYLKLDVSADDSAMKQFSDSGSVSDWAVDAIAWATSHGVMSGTGKGLEPQAQANRAQVAQIILNFSKLLEPAN